MYHFQYKMKNNYKSVNFSIKFYTKVRRNTIGDYQPKGKHKGHRSNRNTLTVDYAYHRNRIFCNLSDY